MIGPNGSPMPPDFNPAYRHAAAAKAAAAAGAEAKPKRGRPKAADEPTISINGGPAHSMAEVRAALHMIKGAAARDAAAGQPQCDLEEATGLSPRQALREHDAGGIAGERLRSIVERIERLEEERKALSSDIKDIFGEAKSAGFDVKVLRQVLRDRRAEPLELEEFETLLDLYRRALEM
jgi:uncharacterized protein (UPF0335 family)